MRTNVKRLQALGFARSGQDDWRNDSGMNVYLSREWIYRTTVMSHGPNAGAEVPQYGEPKIQVTSWILYDLIKHTIIQEHSTLGGLLKWMEHRSKDEELH